MIKPQAKYSINRVSRPLGFFSVPLAACLGVLLVIIFSATCAVASDSNQKAKPSGQSQLSPAQRKLLKKLKKIDKKAAAIKDLTASYKQLVYSPLLKKPLVTNGKLWAKPPVILWASQGQNPTRMRIDGKKLKIFYIKPNVVEVYPIDSRLAASAASPLPELSAMRKLFKLSRGKIKGLPKPPKGAKVLVVRLEPKEKKLAKHVARV